MLATTPDLIIVTGPPAAGKTTIARAIAEELGLPLFSKDGFKDALFDSLGWSDREWSSKVGAAAWELLLIAIRTELAAGRSVVAEGNFKPHHARAFAGRRAIQVFCSAPIEILKDRYSARHAAGERHPGHHEDGVGFDEEPLALDGPVIQVDTTDPATVDVATIVDTIAPVRPEHIRDAAELCVAALTPDRDWTAPAGDLDWTRRRTLDHIPNALSFYAANLASRSSERIDPPRDVQPETPVPALLATVRSTAAILAAVAREAPSGARAFHPAGMADVSGFCAMGCDEILVHTWDIDNAFRASDTLARRVVRRLFPWIDPDPDPWLALLYANGRIPLGGRERLDADWYWHCAPPDEWDGMPVRRSAPPAWT